MIGGPLFEIHIDKNNMLKEIYIDPYLGFP